MPDIQFLSPIFSSQVMSNFLANGLIKNHLSLSRDDFVGLKWGKKIQHIYF